jgi:hypothetical protein
VHNSRPSLPPARFRARRLALTLVLLACGGDGGTGPDPVALVNVLGSPTTPVILGTSVQLTAAVLDAAGSPVVRQGVTWRSSDTLVATVEPTGTVFTVDAGRVTIYAAARGKEGKVELDVREGAVVGAEGGTFVAFVPPAGAAPPKRGMPCGNHP